jgi:hypothetical protein
MPSVTVSDHAAERWFERMSGKSIFGLHVEIENARRIKRNQCHSLGISYQKGFRYYASASCIFVVRAKNKCVVTLWRRRQ